jgi:hypothetical protein
MCTSQRGRRDVFGRVRRSSSSTAPAGAFGADSAPSKSLYYEAKAAAVIYQAVPRHELHA